MGKQQSRSQPRTITQAPFKFNQLNPINQTSTCLTSDARDSASRLRRRSLLTPRSLPSTRPRRALPVPTTVLQDLFSQSKTSPLPRRSAMLPAPVVTTPPSRAKACSPPLRRALETPPSPYRTLLV